MDYQRLTDSANYLKKASNDFAPKVAVVLGSGLGEVAQKVIEPQYEIPYCDIPGFPVATVKGHKGRLILGTAKKSGTPLAVLQGRIHYYEGYTSQEAVMPVRVAGLLGAKTVILTNASGGIRRDLTPGNLMLIKDYILYNVPSPLIGRNFLGERFPDMTQVFDTGLMQAARQSVQKLGIGLKEGVYIQCSGPQFESPAEIKMYEKWGADAVGMSTVIEAIAAKHMGLKVLGISCITNAAAGIAEGPLSSDDVDISAAECADTLAALITEIIQ